MSSLAIIDMGMGNLFSIFHAANHVGFNSVITSDPISISNANAVILPGVGAFAKAMENLKKLELVDVIKDIANRGIPLLGICLGMQLFMEKSQEFGFHDGLSLVKGEVVKIPVSEHQNQLFRVPHIGWNQVNFVREFMSVKNESLKEEVKDPFMYFVHSFYVVPGNEEIISSFTKYGSLNFCSSFVVNNIFACQFHPERSGESGLRFFKQFRKYSRQREN